MGITTDFQNIISLFSQEQLQQVFPRIEFEKLKDEFSQLGLIDTEVYYFNPNIPERNKPGFAKFKNGKIIEIQEHKSSYYNGETKIFAYKIDTANNLIINYNLMKELFFFKL